MPQTCGSRGCVENSIREYCNVGVAKRIHYLCNGDCTRHGCANHMLGQH